MSDLLLMMAAFDGLQVALLGYLLWRTRSSATPTHTPKPLSDETRAFIRQQLQGGGRERLRAHLVARAERRQAQR